MLREHGLRALLFGYILIFVGACAASPLPAQHSTTSSPHLTSTAAVRATAPPLPPGTVLFQANWAQGLARWQASGKWEITQGQLVGESDSSDSATVFFPYRPALANYAIEIRMQIVRLPREGGYWEIFAKRQAGKYGFQAGASNLLGTEPRQFGSHPYAQVFLDPYSAAAPLSGLPIDYEPGFQWHTYRVEIEGNAARLLDNGVQIGAASSNNSEVLSNGPLGLSCASVVLRISSLRFLTL